MMSIFKLSTELKSMVISLLDLQSLINLRQTCSTWKRVIDDASKLDNVLQPARAKLLRLYLDLRTYESFRASRKVIWEDLKSFDRQKWLDGFAADMNRESPDRNLVLPEEFATWILEWPERAVIGWVWPGLDGAFDVDAGKRGRRRMALEDKNQEAPWWRTYGANSLSDYGLGDQRHFPSNFEEDGFSVQEHGCGLSTWVYLGPIKDIYGSVWCECYPYDIDEAIEDHERIGTPLIGDYVNHWVQGDWVKWLRRELNIIENQYQQE
jgi:hypothetical protein